MKMFRFDKKLFFAGLTILTGFTNASFLSCTSVNNQDRKLLVLMEMNLFVFHLVLKQVFNLMSRTNETRSIEWFETCKCECKFRENVCNNKQRWNKDKCRCEYKKLIDKGVFDKRFIWSPSNCECECDKACDVDEL